MEKPRIKPWIESDLNKTETFKVSQRTRIKLPGKPAEVFIKGAEIELSGQQKKDLYFRNVVFYPGDYDKVKAYEKGQRELYKQTPGFAQTAPVANKEVEELKKQNAALLARVTALEEKTEQANANPENQKKK